MFLPLPSMFFSLRSTSPLHPVVAYFCSFYRRFPLFPLSLPLFIADSSRVGLTSILRRHPAYIAGGDRIIVGRISVRFLRGANKTGLRACAPRELWALMRRVTHTYAHARRITLAFRHALARTRASTPDRAHTRARNDEHSAISRPVSLG